MCSSTSKEYDYGMKRFQQINKECWIVYIKNFIQKTSYVRDHVTRLKASRFTQTCLWDIFFSLFISWLTYLMHLVYSAGVKQYTLSQCSFTRVYVGRYTNVSDLIQGDDIARLSMWGVVLKRKMEHKHKIHGHNIPAGLVGT